jgi:hypothetical protein
VRVPDWQTANCPWQIVYRFWKNSAWQIEKYQADVAELADALDLGSSGVTRGGSTPSIRTTL